MRSITIALCLLASVSLAQKKNEPGAGPAAQIVDFTESELKGTIQKPLHQIYFVPPNAKFGCLIQRRMNFNDKLAESVHEM